MFNKKNGLFLLILLMLHLMMCGINHFYLRLTKIYNIHQSFEQHHEAIQYLFMGDSHPAKGIDAAQIPDAFNYAIGGENNVRTYYKLQDALTKRAKKDQQIHTVILPNDITTFTTGANRYEKMNVCYLPFINYYELGSMNGHLIREISTYLKYRLFPYLDLINSTPLNHQQALAHQQIRSQSNNNQVTITQEQADIYIKHITLQNPNNLYDEIALAYLRKTLDLCQAHQVQLIFIKYPCTDFLLKATKNFCGENSRNAPFSPADQLINRYDNVRMLDYEQLFAQKYDLFEDTHHLNAKGKEALTKRLKEDLR